MKTSGKIGWVTMLMVVAVITFASCGNKQKKQDVNQTTTTQPQQAPDSTGVVVEESEIIVVTDSIAPDTTAPAKQTKPAKQK